MVSGYAYRTVDMPAIQPPVRRIVGKAYRRKSVCAYCNGTGMTGLAFVAGEVQEVACYCTPQTFDDIPY